MSEPSAASEAWNSASRSDGFQGIWIKNHGQGILAALLAVKGTPVFSSQGLNLFIHKSEYMVLDSHNGQVQELPPCPVSEGYHLDRRPSVIRGPHGSYHVYLFRGQMKESEGDVVDACYSSESSSWKLLNLRLPDGFDTSIVVAVENRVYALLRCPGQIWSNLAILEGEAWRVIHVLDISLETLSLIIEASNFGRVYA